MGKMFRMNLYAQIGLVAVALASPVQASDAWPSGLFEIEYRLEMPHLERYSIPRRMQHCMSGDQTVVPVMSGNGVFHDCAIEEMKRSRNGLSYALICEGVSGARAFASYKTTPEGFAGRVLVKLGAKNMTLTEVHAARRLGSCPDGVSE